MKAAAEKPTPQGPIRESVFHYRSLFSAKANQYSKTPNRYLSELDS